jgi:hypothetical protein
MVGAKMSMKAESHLQFINRFGRDSRREDLMQTLEDIMAPLETPDAFFNRETRLDGVIHRAQAGQRWHISIRFVFVHRDLISSQSTTVPANG